VRIGIVEKRKSKPLPATAPTSAPAGYTSFSAFGGDLLAAMNSGQDIYFPPGTYQFDDLGEYVVKPNQKVIGAGKNATIFRGAGIDMADNTTLAHVGVEGATEADNRHGISFEQTGARVTGAQIENCRVEGYLRGLRAWRMDSIVFRNNEILRCEYGWYGRFRDTHILDNLVDTQGKSDAYASGGEMQSAQNCVIRGNICQGGSVVGILFLNDYEGTIDSVVENNLVEGNTVSGVTEESISFDTRGNDAERMHGRAVDTVAGVSGNTVTLSSPNWATAGSLFSGQYLMYRSGAEKGRVAKIASQTDASFTLAAGSDLPQPGDQVVVGAPFLNNTVRDNTVDASNGFSGIIGWGLNYGTVIEWNRVTGPNRLEQYGEGDPWNSAIKLASLDGIAAAGAISATPCGRHAPSDGFVVRSNAITTTGTPKPTDRVLVINYNFGRCPDPYTPALNVIENNQQPTQTGSWP